MATSKVTGKVLELKKSKDTKNYTVFTDSEDRITPLYLKNDVVSELEIGDSVKVTIEAG